MQPDVFSHHELETARPQATVARVAFPRAVAHRYEVQRRATQPASRQQACLQSESLPDSPKGVSRKIHGLSVPRPVPNTSDIESSPQSSIANGGQIVSSESSLIHIEEETRLGMVSRGPRVTLPSGVINSDVSEWDLPRLHPLSLRSRAARVHERMNGDLYGERKSVEVPAFTRLTAWQPNYSIGVVEGDHTFIEALAFNRCPQAAPEEIFQRQRWFGGGKKSRGRVCVTLIHVETHLSSLDRSSPEGISAEALFGLSETDCSKTCAHECIVPEFISDRRWQTTGADVRMNGRAVDGYDRRMSGSHQRAVGDISWSGAAGASIANIFRLVERGKVCRVSIWLLIGALLLQTVTATDTIDLGTGRQAGGPHADVTTRHTTAQDDPSRLTAIYFVFSAVPTAVVGVAYGLGALVIAALGRLGHSAVEAGKWLCHNTGCALGGAVALECIAWSVVIGLADLGANLTLVATLLGIVWLCTVVPWSWLAYRGHVKRERGNKFSLFGSIFSILYVHTLALSSGLSLQQSFALIPPCISFAIWTASLSVSGEEDMFPMAGLVRDSLQPQASV